MSSAARNAASDACCEISTACIRVPPACGLAVLGELDVWEDIAKRRVADDVADLAPVLIYREVGAVRGGDDFALWIAAKVPGRKAPRDQLGLSMARRCLDNSSTYLATLDLLQKLTDIFVMRRRLPARVRVACEREEAVRRLDAGAVLGFERFEVNRTAPCAAWLWTIALR